MSHYLPDPRPYPSSQNKNEILSYVNTLIENRSSSAAKMLENSLTNMLSTNHYQSLSVALALAPSLEHYQLIWEFLNHVLMAKGEERQLLVLPLVLVLGSTTEKSIPLTFPQQDFVSFFSKSASWLSEVTWYPNLIPLESISQIKVEQWYKAKTEIKLLIDDLSSSKPTSLNLKAGQNTQLVYVLGWGNKNLQSILKEEKETLNLLQVMQFWNHYFSQFELTPFVNPLPVSTPLIGLSSATQMKKRMELNIFLTNSIRTIRLKGLRVAAVMAAKEGGQIETVIQVLEGNPFVYQFIWQLSPMDNLAELESEWIHLLQDCQMENVWVLKDLQAVNAVLPNYQEAIKLPGSNPFLTNTN